MVNYKKSELSHTIYGSFCYHNCEYGEDCNGHLHFDEEKKVYYCFECEFTISIERIRKRKELVNNFVKELFENKEENEK